MRFGSKTYPFAVLLVKQVFTNDDGSHGVLRYPGDSDDLTLAYDRITKLFQKRWEH
ncbi:MAG: hypothetical protein WKF84_08415 [Pyrinomonadaceae bacterium]